MEIFIFYNSFLITLIAIIVTITSFSITRKEKYKDVIRLQQGMTFKYEKKNGKFIHTLCDGKLVYRLGISPEQVIGQELHHFLPPEMASKKEQYYSMAWEGAEDITYEGQLNSITYLATLSPIKRNGKVIEVIASCIEITDRKRFEEELKQSEERYRRLVELSPDLIGIHNNGIIAYMNEAGVKLLGASNSQELIGKSLFEYLHPDYFDLVKERIKNMYNTGKRGELVEEKILLPNGQVIDIETTAVAVSFNGDIAIQTVVRDITERKRVERALRESEEKYRLIAENMTDLIVVMDVDGIITYASPSHKAILGLNPTEYEGKSPFSYIHPEDRPHVQKVFQECVRTKVPSQAEFRFLHTNESWIYLESKAMPVTAECGKMHGVVVTTRDITERKLTEEYLRKSDRLTVVGQLAAGVAHEIRNPLTSLKGFLQLLKPVIVEKRFYEIMNSELDRIESIIREYLVLAKPQMVKVESKDIDSIMEHVIALAQTEANMNNIEIRYEIETGLPLIRCEENQLKQVFINILKNGIEAMPSGGSITIVITRKDDGHLLIRFIDEGNGIPEEILSKLGEPFYTTKDKGTGLGLMVSYKIIENHNGTIKIVSEIDKGTIVEIVLPVEREHYLE